MMKTSFNCKKALLFSIIACLLMLTGVCSAQSDMEKGIQAYRQENYIQAVEIFQQRHKASPENTKITYYLAIAQAQQGHYAEARRLYQEITLLNPQSPEALLAKQGLAYLPDEKETDLDPPPKFTKPNEETAFKPSPAASQQIAPTTVPHFSPYQSPQPNTGTYGGMSPQEMMALQSLLGSGNNNGMNPMSMLPWMYAQSGGNPANGHGPVMDPQLFSTILSNQLLQNMTLDEGQNKQ